MAIAFDAATESVRTDTSDPYAFDHTPSGTPRGIVVAAVHGASSTDHIDGITYGGVAMKRVVTAWTSSAEPGRAELWFLGASIPTGTQSVSSNLASGTTDDIHFVAISLTASADTEPIDAGRVSPDQDTNNFPANVTKTLYYRGQTAIAIGAHYGGGADGSAFAPSANSETVHDHDLGAFYSEVTRQSTPGTSDFAIGGTVSSDDAAFCCAAFSEVALTGFPFPGPGPKNYVDMTETTTTADGKSYNMNLPPTVDAGDLLLAFVNFRAHTSATAITATGWTVLDQRFSNGNNWASAVLAKDAVGSEDGGTVAVVINSPSVDSIAFNAHCYRIPVGTWADSGTLTDDVAALGQVINSGANPDPVSLTPAWGSAKTLWFNAAGGFSDFTALPSANYTWHKQLTIDEAPDMLNTSFRKAETDTEDPGAWTGGTGNWFTFTAAVRPFEAPSNPAIFPQRVSTTETEFNTSSTSHLAAMPSGIVSADDLLVVAIVVQGTITITTPSGWTALHTLQATGHKFALYGKAAIGNESATTVDFVTNNACVGVCQTFQFTDWRNSGVLTDDIQAASINYPTGTATPDPPALNPSTWDVEKTLWMAFSARQNGHTPVTLPSTYTGGTQTLTDSFGANLVSCEHENEVASEDPDIFSWGANVATSAATMGIRPAEFGSEPADDRRGLISMVYLQTPVGEPEPEPDPRRGIVTMTYLQTPDGARRGIISMVHLITPDAGGGGSTEPSPWTGTGVTAWLKGL